MGTNNKIEIQELFGGLKPSEPAYSWYVVHTKPRWEKKFAHYMEQYKISYYIPLQDSIKTYDKRKVVFRKPLFPGYAFVNCQKEDQSILLRSGCVVRFLNVPDEEELLADLQNIYHTLEVCKEISPHLYLKEGYRVKITSGPFVGVEGVVIDAENPAEVIVGIHIIQQAVCIEVDPRDLELVARAGEPGEGDENNFEF